MSVLDGPGEGTWSVFALKVAEERDALREEVARLNTLLLSVTGENQKRAEREACALEDWRELRAENDRLKSSRLPDVEYARLDVLWQQMVRERDELKARLAHAEADAEQAIHNEAFNERQRIAAWLRTTPRARGVLINIISSHDVARLADAIEAGEHER